jgi:hypothetical protein
MSKPIICKNNRFLWQVGRMTMGLFLLSFFMSCADSGGNEPLFMPEKMPHNVAVVFSDEFNMGSGDHYSVSKALQTELFNCVGNVYSNIVEEFEIPAEGEHDRIIKFMLNEVARDEHNLRLANATDPALTSRHIPLRFRISISITSYNGENGELIKTKVVKGIGESSDREGVEIRGGRGILSSTDPDSFDRAVTEAMENICSDVTKLLIRGFAEPKN